MLLFREEPEGLGSAVEWDWGRLALPSPALPFLLRASQAEALEPSSGVRCPPRRVSASRCWPALLWALLLLKSPRGRKGAMALSSGRGEGGHGPSSLSLLCFVHLLLGEDVVCSSV